MTNDISIRNEAGMGNIGNATIHIKNKTASHTRTQTIRKISRKKSKTKQLNYNTREISSQLLRAVKSRSASIVLVRAKTKVGVLKRCLGTGQYNDREVLAAIAHAQRIVNCAKLKVKNLKEEEQQKHKNEEEQVNAKQQIKNEIKHKVSQKERELENKIALERMQQLRKEKTKRQELIRKRKMHRNEELRKIQEADMKYLKEKTGKSDYSQSDFSGARLELSGAAMRLNELRLSEHAIALAEQQIEQEIEEQVEMQAEGLSLGTSSAADGGIIPKMPTTDSTVSAAAIDISI